jgi:hypothetical protein
MRDLSWLEDGITRVRHTEYRDSVGVYLNRERGYALVQFDGDACASSVHVDDLEPEKEAT